MQIQINAHQNIEVHEELTDEISGIVESALNRLIENTLGRLHDHKSRRATSNQKE